MNDELGKRHAWVVWVVGLAVCLLAAPGPASASEKPIRGGTYYGSKYGIENGQFRQAYAELVVSRDGKSFVRSGEPYVSVHSPCGANVPLTSAIRIRPDGSFRTVKRRGRTTLRLHGRFTERWSVRLVIRLRPGFCKVGPRVLVLKHLGNLPVRNCRTHPAQTVAESPEGRIFVHYRRDQPPGLLTRTFACLFSTNERVPLARDTQGLSHSDYRMAGRFAGYKQGACGPTAYCSVDYHITDLRDGSSATLPELPEGVTDFVVGANAAVALIRDPPGNIVPIEVRVVIGSAATAIDSGEGIDPTSLDLEGNTLRWIKDGVPRTAPL